MIIQTFDQAWAYTDTLKGWYTKEEGRLLWNCVVPGDTICEVGSYRGRSTSLLAAAGATIHVIEPFLLAPGSANDTLESQGRYISEETQPMIFASFFKYLARFGDQIILHPTTTEKAWESLPKLDMVHIDGDHMEGIFTDMKLVVAKLKPGGIAVFHDYEPIHTKFTRVKEAVDALGWNIGCFRGRADSAIAIRKP